MNKGQFIQTLIGLFITALVLGAPASAGSIILPDAGTINLQYWTGMDHGKSTYLIGELVPHPYEYAGGSRYRFWYDAALGSWRAENEGQRIGILVTKSGQVTFLSTGGTAGFRLAGIGRAREGTGLPAARIHTDGDRLELSHGDVTEWYVNGENGIEQGMTIHSRPAGNGTLLASFNLEGDLRPVMAGQSLVFFNATGPTMYYGGLAAYDAAGRDLPATMSLSSCTLRWEIDDRDAVYPVVIDPWIATQADPLTSSDWAGTGNAWFGNSVAVSGDGKTAIIGAEAASFSGMDYAGQSYVFTNSGGTWPQSAILNASDKASEAQFGHSVAISGDGNTAIIGAPYATWNSQVYAGQAYIFKNSGGEWSEAAILNASDAAVNARFGSSVAISDDGNTVLIGAYRATGNSQALAGQAYIFSNSGVEWSELAILNASGDAKYMAWFGDSAALSGDKSTAVIGARGFNSNTGKAYIFTSSEGEWHQSATPLTVPDAVAGDSFGYSVAISDDGNTALIGAPNSGSGAGKAYIFTSSEGEWHQSATPLTAPDGVASDHFGYSVAVSGDTAVVGAYWASADIWKTNSGKAYVFKRSGTAWTPKIVVIPSDTAKNDYFGYSVALSNDGITSVIGANGFNSNRGKAYVFDFLSTAPQVYGIAPSSWPNTSYRTVVVSGNGFSTTGKPVLNLTRAGYSNISLTNTFPESAQSFSVSVPHHIDAGIWNVTVINPDGEEGTNASVTFTVTAPPILDGISPASGQNTGTTLVTVTGIQFNCTIAPTVNLTQTGYNNITMTATNLSTTSFTVSVPSDLDKGVWNFVVINPDGLEGTNAGVTFTVIAPPRLTGISPTCGADAPSTSVTITGSYFDISTAPVVNLSSAGQTNITLTPTEFSATSLKVTVPNNNIDAIWNITVINPDGLEGTNASVTFSTIDPPPVADFSFGPAEGIPPLTVTFTDKTSNAPDSWLWDFGDGDTTGATDQNPVHTYTKPGRYTVSLSATNSEGTGTKTARKAITVFMPLTPVTALNAGSHAADDDLSWTAVELSQDGNTAILGGGWITIGTSPPGRAWFFQKDGGTWNWVQALIPSESAESDLFGDSIAISDDGNTALIAADNANIGTELWSGKVYVFTNSAGTWSQSQMLKASDYQSSGHFGNSLAMSGDGNTAVIGSYMAGAGKAYVFTRNGEGKWSENRILTSSDPDANDFGFSVALSDDGNTALVGAPDSNDGAVNYAGKVYTFTRNGEGIWSENQVLSPSVPNETAHFGWSVAISGDGNTAVIGAPNYKIPAPEEYDHKKYPGQAYVFTRDGGGIWSETQALNDVTNSPRLEEMGGTVAISDDGNTIYIDHSRLEYRTRIYQNDGESWYITHALIPPSDDPVHFVGSVVFHGTSIFAGTKMNKTTADGTGQAYFFTLSSPAPVVAGISPSSGTNTKDNPVTITGTNFDTGSSPVVKLTRSGYADVTLGVVSGTGISLVRTVPAHVAAGTWNVVVTNPDGQSGTSASVTYTVTAPPSVSSVIPATGLNTGPVSVGITGSQFNTNMPGGTTLNLTRSGYSNISVFGISPASATGFSANIPITGAGAGTWYIVVVNPDGQESTESIPFRITGPDTLAPPSVSSVSPATGLNTGTMTAVIAGTGFNTTMPGGTTLNLTRSGYSNISVFGISPASATDFSANIPITGAGAGTWYIVVVNPDGQESMEIIPFVITSPDSAPTLTPTATATTTMTNLGSSGSGGSTSTGRHYTSTGHGSNPAGESKSPLSLGNNNGNGAPPGASGPAGDSGSTGAPGGTSQSGTGLPLSVTTALIGAGGIGIAGSAWYIRQWRIEKRENDPLWWRGGK